jgi:hypothetical protein
MVRRRKARSRKKKSRKKAKVERRVQLRSIVVKMNHPARKNPTAEGKLSSADPLYASPMPKPGVTTIAYEIQKPPYDDRAVAPKVLPTAISLPNCYYIKKAECKIYLSLYIYTYHMPASN